MIYFEASWYTAVADNKLFALGRIYKHFENTMYEILTDT